MTAGFLVRKTMKRTISAIQTLMRIVVGGGAEKFMFEYNIFNKNKCRKLQQNLIYTPK